MSADERRRVRLEKSKPLVMAFKPWLEHQLARVSGKAGIAEELRYGLNHWEGLIRFLDDGRIELDTNIVERGILEDRYDVAIADRRPVEGDHSLAVGRSRKMELIRRQGQENLPRAAQLAEPREDETDRLPEPHAGVEAEAHLAVPDVTDRYADPQLAAPRLGSRGVVQTPAHIRFEAINDARRWRALLVGRRLQSFGDVVLMVFRSTPTWRAMALTDGPWRCKSRIMTSSPSLITGSSLPSAGGASAIRRARLPCPACPGRRAVTKTGEISNVTSGENCSATHGRQSPWRSLRAWPSRPTMRLVPVKTEEQQARAMLFRTRDLFVRQRTQLINALRGHLAEHGVVAPQGPANVKVLAAAIEEATTSFPLLVVELSRLFLAQIDELSKKIAELERATVQEAAHGATTRRLQTTPGVGPITAMVIETFAPPMEVFRRGRDFAAWLGLVPRQHSTGGKRLQIVGAMAVVRGACRRKGAEGTWVYRMLMRKPRKLVAVALANKMARSIWPC